MTLFMDLVNVFSKDVPYIKKEKIQILFLRLLSRWTLQNYKNFIKLKP